ncbi:MAG: anti-sigma B factor antagonist [Cyclobacteriaceae bacterium]|jgi:anti-sigma B factor antagonist
MSKVDIVKNIEGDIYEVKVSGDVDASSSIHLDNALEEAFTAKEKKVLINLQEMNYISSAGLGVFIARLEEVKMQGIQLSFCELQPNVKQVFALLGLEELLSIYDSREDAISAYSK